ncbi:SMI1/KNR4 family protein [Streptomyces kasugaensis]|uniref:SMI1/KNR4 family protein n=1 Tax=Streptomyces kasugaensis TaxID=1946 RepID=A0A4Q9HM28_STRKA|nr:SMI1/KNR4 family protein [Streptomyces kasugaensis]TBO55854.1 SMI1/KNR4 family protein [Streptomyces kasugaensis]
MTEEQYLEALFTMLGKPACRYANPEAWAALEGDLGVALPTDYKRIIDGYGPVKLNGHLYLKHPATKDWNLAEEMRSTAHVWSEVSWDGVDLEFDPRSSLGIPEIRFGTPDGLIYAVSTNGGGEAVFLGKGVTGRGWRIFVYLDGEFYEYDMSFSEWLYRYLIGENMTGPYSSRFIPGPVKFESLPMSAGDTPVTWYGPDRGM